MSKYLMIFLNVCVFKLVLKFFVEFCIWVNGFYIFGYYIIEVYTIYSGERKYL